MDRDALRSFLTGFMERVSGAALLAAVGVADRAGLFRALAGRGPRTLAEIVAASGLDERYARELVHALAAGGLLQHDPARDTFELPEAVAACLADPESPYFMGGWPQALGALYRVVPDVARACREGGGVPFSAYGSEWVEALDRTNGPGLRVLLTRKWLAALPDVVKRLDAGGRVADVGCGSGAAVHAMARAFPRATVVGFDVDAPSLERAREEAARQGLENARFERCSADELPSDPPFDLITAFDVIHDLARPREALARIREALHPEGAFLLVEPDAGDSLADNCNPRGALFYAMSLLHCMTVSLAQGGEGLGAALGPERTQALCREAGFGQVRRLPIENPFNAFFELRR